jgi:hypothetical protein
VLELFRAQGFIALQIFDFSSLVNWSTTKKCAPYFRGNMEFPIYLGNESVVINQYAT